MENYKHWAEILKPGDSVKAFIRHRVDGTKNRNNVKIIVTTNCKDFGMNSIIGKDEEGITYRIPYNELSK